MAEEWDKDARFNQQVNAVSWIFHCLISVATFGGQTESETLSSHSKLVRFPIVSGFKMLVHLSKKKLAFEHLIPFLRFLSLSLNWFQLFIDTQNWNLCHITVHFPDLTYISVLWYTKQITEDIDVYLISLSSCIDLRRSEGSGDILDIQVEFVEGFKWFIDIFMLFENRNQVYS